MKYHRVTAIVILVALSSMMTGAPVTNDWPQWRGPERDGISAEKGLLKQWPAAGPKQVWSISNLGEGYGSLSIQGERIFVQGTTRSASVVYSLNRADGKTVWTASLGPKVDEGRGNGPRSTPTIDGDRIYVLTENGDLACLRAKDGSRIWSRNILRDFGGDNPKWLISESPLIDGNRVIVSPGGSGAGIVALDKMSGKTVWAAKELSDEAGYSSCIIEDVGGVRTIMNFTSSAAVGVRASDGKVMWRHTKAANRTANCTTPVFHNNKVFFSSAYDTGAVLLDLTARGGEVQAREVYFTRDMMNHHGGVVLVNGYLYGFSNSILTCLEFATGKKMWSARSVGKGSLTYADGMLYLFGENNSVALAEATPSGYNEKGRFTVQDQGRPSWAHPVVAGGRLYIRNQGILTAYDVRQ
ncbi:MAG: PQQ-binding-like beta-propeller repeat protein [Blastocatellales bacterium]